MSEPPAKSSGSLEALLDESRRFPPPERFQKHANQNDLGIYERAGSDVEAFWAEQAEGLDWIKKWDRVLEWNLAWARIGAPHSVVFGGFSSESLAGRINDAESRVVVTADGAYRRGTIVPLKQNVDAALENCPGAEHVVVVDRVGEKSKAGLVEGRDHLWNDLMEKADSYWSPEPMDSEDILYLLYTSGTTGKPKGIVHTTAGYLVGVSTTHKWVFDVKDEDVYWCTADIGWVTGHSYIVYGPLANGTTSVMYEGAPDWPDKDRFWSTGAKSRVKSIYSAPTAIRTFMRWGAEHVKKHDLSSLRLLGTVGEPINPEAWMWYHKVVGGERCPIV